jgi:hypothetical protein
MGCDIHAFVEVKLAGEWHCYHACDLGRDYELFAKMADVRNYGSVEPISKPRGLPLDLSAVVEFEAKHWGADGHSHSYLTLDEVAPLEKWLEGPPRKKWAPFGYVFGNGWCRSDLPEGVEDVRLVFWFDN